MINITMIYLWLLGFIIMSTYMVLLSVSFILSISMRDLNLDKMKTLELLDILTSLSLMQKSEYHFTWHQQ
jgi:hypothetical protein